MCAATLSAVAMLENARRALRRLIGKSAPSDGRWHGLDCEEKDGEASGVGRRVRSPRLWSKLNRDRCVFAAKSSYILRSVKSDTYDGRD